MECTKYRNSPLTRVILHITFPQLLGLSENKPPDKFQKAINEEFPYMNIRKGHDVSVDLTPATPVINRKENIVWEFRNRDNSKYVYANEKSLQIQFIKYDNFEEFLEIVEFVFKTFREIYPINVFKIGLRYINEVKIKDASDPRDWKGLIKESLIATEEFVSHEDNVIRSMHVLEVNEDDYKFRFQFGLFNSNYPNSIIDKEFILDYDCVSIEELGKKEFHPAIVRFHKIIKKWFEESIEDELRDKLGCEK